MVVERSRKKIVALLVLIAKSIVIFSISAFLVEFLTVRFPMYGFWIDKLIYIAAMVIFVYFAIVPASRILGGDDGREIRNRDV